MPLFLAQQSHVTTHVKVSPRTHEQASRQEDFVLCFDLMVPRCRTWLAARCLRPAATQASVVFCCEPGPVIAHVLELSEGEICSLLFAIRYVQQARSFSVLPRSPVRSSAVPRSETEGKRRAVSVRQSNSMVHSFSYAATDAIHSLSSQISVSEFYRRYRESGRSPSSLLCTSLLSQTILEFGNHCLWFRTSAVRKMRRLSSHLRR